jgi:hypothetical protein
LVDCQISFRLYRRHRGTARQRVVNHCGGLKNDEHFGLAVPEFLFIDDPGLEDETYLGKPAPLKVNLAFGWCGDTQVELILPIAGVSTYSKFLDHNPKGGMHHYGIEVANYAQGVKDMESGGFSVVQGGRHNETKFAYGNDRGADGDRLSPARGKGLHEDAEAQEVTDTFVAAGLDQRRTSTDLL